MSVDCIQGHIFISPTIESLTAPELDSLKLYIKTSTKIITLTPKFPANRWIRNVVPRTSGTTIKLSSAHKIIKCSQIYSVEPVIDVPAKSKSSTKK